MDSKKSRTDPFEAQIKSLFLQCSVPSRGSSSRVVSILKKGLYELSVRDLLAFASALVRTMLVLAIGPKKSSMVDGETK